MYMTKLRATRLIGLAIGLGLCSAMLVASAAMAQMPLGSQVTLADLALVPVPLLAVMPLGPKITQLVPLQMSAWA